MPVLTYEAEILTQTKTVKIKYYRVLGNKDQWIDKIRNQDIVQNLKIITVRKVGKSVAWTCAMHAGSWISLERMRNESLTIDH